MPAEEDGVVDDAEKIHATTDGTSPGNEWPTVNGALIRYSA